MTKNTKKNKSRRSRLQYPALNPNYNTKIRKLYIEPDYVNGVQDKDGNMVIRPLNDEEKAWLNKFYEEFIITSFKKDGSDFHENKEKQRELYRNNNKRNSCIYNQKTAQRMLYSIDDVGYDTFIGNSDIDWELALIESIEKPDFH